MLLGRWAERGGCGVNPCNLSSPSVCRRLTGAFVEEGTVGERRVGGRVETDPPDTAFEWRIPVTREWLDSRDEKEWIVEAVYVMPRQEPGEPIAMMGPDVPQRIRFRSGREEHSLVARLGNPIDGLPDQVMMALLDEARKLG